LRHISESKNTAFGRQPELQDSDGSRAAQPLAPLVEITPALSDNGLIVVAGAACSRSHSNLDAISVTAIETDRGALPLSSDGRRAPEMIDIHSRLAAYSAHA